MQLLLSITSHSLDRKKELRCEISGFFDAQPLLEKKKHRERTDHPNLTALRCTQKTSLCHLEFFFLSFFFFDTFFFAILILILLFYHHHPFFIAHLVNILFSSSSPPILLRHLLLALNHLITLDSSCRTISSLVSFHPSYLFFRALAFCILPQPLPTSRNPRHLFFLKNVCFYCWYVLTHFHSTPRSSMPHPIPRLYSHTYTHSLPSATTESKPEAVAPAVDAAATSPASAAADVSAVAGDEQNFEGANIDPNATLLVRALVSTKEAGIIIGKGGANVAELREQTGVKAGVSKVVPGVHDRVLSVTGTLVGISDAFALIAKTILENPLNAPVQADGSPAEATAQSTSVRLLISHNLMGTVIGRQGLKIKHIQDLSGARMVASKEMLPQSTERVVEVQGSVEAIRVAIHEIVKCLAEDWDRSQNVVLYQPGQGEGPGILAAGGMGGLQQQGSRRQGGPAYLAGAMANMNLNSNNGSFNNNNNNHHHSNRNNSNNQNNSRRTDPNAVVTPGGGLVAGATTNSANAGEPNASAPPLVDAANLRTQNISIPSDMVGCIIGKGGSKITEIRRLSGSRISIAKVPHDETGERMFTIQGTPEANEKALFLLYNQLETEKERRQKQTNAAAQPNGGVDGEDTPAVAATSA